MIKLSEWERDKFINSSHMPDLTVIFPSREIYFSQNLLHVMRLAYDTCPKTLDQWYELCHPEDHATISKLEHAIYGQENFLSFTRRLYCGDGYYRSFRLEAYVQRTPDARPAKLTATETLALNAWLQTAQDGDTIECTDDSGRVRVLEAVRVQGVMTLRDYGEIQDLQQENLRLRREIQRRIFAGKSPEDIIPEEFDGTESVIRNMLGDCINAALNVLTGNNQLKALRRSLAETCITVGISGLTSSGKSSFMNALLGERLIPDQTRATTNIPVICREGKLRSVKILYQDGRIDEAELTASYMKTIASESGNPSNKAGIARIELTVPGALIPEGICFVDTPGFDALAGSGGGALRNILPELDVIIYVTPVRARLKSSDYEYIKLITSMTDRIIFVLSQIDLERGDTEAGRIINTAHDKILWDIQGLRHDMKNFCGYDVDVIPVSAKIALEKFYARNSQEWQNSNIQEVMNYLAPLRENSYIRALVFRTERVMSILDRIISRREVTGSSRWRLQEVMNNLSRILSACQGLGEIAGRYSFREEVIMNDSGPKNLLSSLITSMREREFRTKFFALEAFGNRRKAVLLGAEREQSLKLYSRLAHNLRLESLPDGGSSSREWLHSGHLPPWGCIMLPAIGNSEEILIAPSDANITGNHDWHKLFREYIPVVSIDLARVDSGLSDLAHSPYITGLTAANWVLAFGNAGMFDTRQIDLVSQVPKRVQEFIELNGLKNPDWFIFENYKIF